MLFDWDVLLIIHYKSSCYYERNTIIKIPGVCICLVSPYLLCKFQPSPPSHLQSITRCLYLYLYCWHLQITWGLYLFLANLSANSHLLLLNHNQLFLSPPSSLLRSTFTLNLTNLQPSTMKCTSLNCFLNLDHFSSFSDDFSNK